MYNFVENRTDEVLSLDSVEEAMQYVPQDSAVLEQLRDYVNAGNSFAEAIAFVTDDYFTVMYELLSNWYNEENTDNESSN